MARGKPNNKGTELRATKLKVTTSYIISLGVIFVLALIAFISFYKILNSVETLYQRKDKSNLVRRISSGILEMKTSSKIYSITFKSWDLTSFANKTKEVSNLIDSLRQGSLLKDDKRFTDSLSSLFKQYSFSLNQWLAVKAVGNKKDLLVIADTLEQQTHSLLLSISPPTSTTITIREFSEIHPAPSQMKNLDTTKPHSGFLKRLFSKKKKVIQPTTTFTSSISLSPLMETSTKADTSYHLKLDTLISNVRTALSTSETAKNSRKVKLAKIEMKILHYQSELLGNIDNLLKAIELKNLNVIQSKINSAKQVAQNSSQTIFGIGICALGLIIVFLIVIRRDLTKSAYYKQQLEIAKAQAEGLAKAKHDFLANMSHEIRTPLTSIIGFSEQLSETQLQPNQAKHLNFISSSSEHLLAVVNEILDYSKIEAGALKIQKVDFLINEVITSVINAMSLKAEKQGISLTYDSSVNCTLSGDAVRLRQILLNLVGNGLKFTENGFVRIKVTAQKREGDHLVRFEIEDSGIGIKKSKLNNIFTDFSQISNGINLHYQGTGLGLSISKKLIEMQNGRIWVKSQENVGSVFYFEIPYSVPASPGGILRSHEKREYGAELKNKKVLIVDDDPMIQILLEPILNDWAVIHKFCRSAEEAIQIMTTIAFDIIIQDIQMAGNSGLELIEQIQNGSLVKGSKIKVIICTSNTLLEIPKSVDNSCEIKTLFKPFKKSELWQTLCAACETEPVNREKHDLFALPESPNTFSLNNFTVYANGDLKTLEQFISAFINQTKQELALMHEGLSFQRFKEIAEIAHKIKNTCGQLEANNVVATLKELEIASCYKYPDPTRIRTLINSLENLCYHLFIQLENKLQDLYTHR